MIVAYLRVSTGKQLLENQKNEISAFAQNRYMVIDQWVTQRLRADANRETTVTSERCCVA